MSEQTHDHATSHNAAHVQRELPEAAAGLTKAMARALACTVRLHPMHARLDAQRHHPCISHRMGSWKPQATAEKAVCRKGPMFDNATAHAPCPTQDRDSSLRGDEEGKGCTPHGRTHASCDDLRTLTDAVQRQFLVNFAAENEGMPHDAVTPGQVGGDGDAAGVIGTPCVSCDVIVAYGTGQMLVLPCGLRELGKYH